MADGTSNQGRLPNGWTPKVERLTAALQEIADAGDGFQADRLAYVRQVARDALAKGGSMRGDDLQDIRDLHDDAPDFVQPNGWTLCAGCPVRDARNLATEVTLCQHTHEEATEGRCPVHGGDACLRQYEPVLRGRPDTAEGERRLTEDVARLRKALEAISACFFAPDYDAPKWAKIARAALRVGGAQSQEDSE